MSAPAQSQPKPQPLARPALHISGLRYRWPGAAADTLQIDDLQLAAGQTVFLRGPSGCGKSTLLSLAAGVMLAQAGQVRLLGQDWAALRPGARDRFRADHLGYIFQQFNLLPYLSAIDNVRRALRFSARRAARAGLDRLDPPDGHSAAGQLLARSGLPRALWAQPAGQLSVGQQQRVAAARALIGAPEVVIADEPTSALDDDLRQAFMALLLQSCHDAGSALLFVSHDLRLAERFDRVINLPDINRALIHPATTPATTPPVIEPAA